MNWQEESLAHFKNLLRFRTINPPGDEMPALLYLKEIFDNEGIENWLFDTEKNRGNLVAKIKGDGSEKPLHISSHVDVVPVEEDKWDLPPFGGEEKDGFVYGRGTIDMKNHTAMCLQTMLTAKRENWPLKRDLIFSAVSDEEDGSYAGMDDLVNNHADLIQAEYYLGEVGGATMYAWGKPFYPVQIGEKGVFWLKVFLEGEAGHGSVPRPHNVHFRLAKFLMDLKKTPKCHLTNSYKAFIKQLITLAPPAEKTMLKVLQTPFAARALHQVSRALGDSGTSASNLLATVTNTVNPTGLKSGKKHNVVPSSLEVKLDCRVLPGFSKEDVINEIESKTGERLKYELIESQPGHEGDPNTPVFKIIERVLKEKHPEAITIPSLSVGFTDACRVVKLGTKCYGFTPVKLPPSENFSELFHGHNERIPVEGFHWGVEALQEVCRRICCES
jgi:acetylornithine deacetylase/succinyl-diaminopimelate desuccinylase-like protein